MQSDTCIADLEPIRLLIQDPTFQSDVAAMQTLIREAVPNHDLSKFVELHKMLHDFDYWVINYPAYFPLTAPPDWGGITCYYGVLSDID